MKHFYFALSLKRETLDIVRRRNAAGLVCELGISAGQAKKDTRCTFVVAPDLSAELNPEFSTAASLGAQVEKTTLIDEEHKLATHELSMAHRFYPKSAADFIGFWFSQLEHHVCAWDVKKTPVVFLIWGPAGVGKTCSVEVILPLKLGKRFCKVYTVAPEELEDEYENSDSKNGVDQTTTAYDAALEHCRRVKTGELAKDAMFVVFYDDIDMITNNAIAARVKNDFVHIGKLTKQFPSNVSIVASCTDWYNKRGLVRSLRSDKTSGFVVEVCKVKPLSTDSIQRRLNQLFGNIPLNQLQEIAVAASGNMWAALHAADFYRLQPKKKENAIAAMDRENVNAACEQIRELTRINRQKRSMFEAIDIHADVDYGADAIFSNYAGLVPTANRQRSIDQNNLVALETIAQIDDMLSVGDLYDNHQRNSNYAGRNGVDIDKQISIALNVTVPCTRLSLATTAASNPPNGRMVYVDDAARKCRENLQSNTELLINMAPRLRLLETQPTNVAWLLQNVTPTINNRGLVMRLPFDLNWIDQLTHIGKRGIEFVQNMGFEKENVIKLVLFARSLVNSATTVSTVTAEYNALEKKKNNKLVKRLPPTGVDGTQKTARKRKTAAEPSANTVNTTQPKRAKQTKINFGKLAI